MTRPDGPDNQEFDDPMLPPLDDLYGTVATPFTDDMLDRMLAIAIDPATPDPGVDLPSFDIDLNDFDDYANHDDVYVGAAHGFDGFDHDGFDAHGTHGHGGVDSDDLDDGDADDDLSDFFDAPDDAGFGDAVDGHAGDGHIGDGHIGDGHGLHDFGHYGDPGHGFADGLDDDLLGGM